MVALIALGGAPICPFRRKARASIPKPRRPPATAPMSPVAAAAIAPIWRAAATRRRWAAMVSSRPFGNRSTKDLYNFIAASMPAGAPGSLSEEQYTNITAYLLYANGAKAGTTANLSKNTDVKISTIADGKVRGGRSDRAAQPRWARWSRHGSARRAAECAPPATGPDGQGHSEELCRCHRRHAQQPAGRRMADVPPQLSGLELFASQADHARQCEEP